MNSRYCIVVTGATGVGKTDFSLELGNSLPIEIVNADLGQFYQPLTIGTAKPQWQKEKIKHHLFDILSEPRSSTIMGYRTILQECLQSIWDRNMIPVIVGGSTLYIESIFFEPISMPIVHTDSMNTISISESKILWQKLNAIDPQRASEIHPHDTYRIKRALAIWNSTEIKPSDKKPFFNPVSLFHFYYLTRDRSDLYTRINERVITMIDNGWLDEVTALLHTPWYDFIMMKKFIGYPDLCNFSLQGCPAAQKNILLETIAQKTRNYAKRQETYFKRLEKKIYNCLVMAPEYTYHKKSTMHRLNLTSADCVVYSKQQAKLIRSLSESNLV